MISDHIPPLMKNLNSNVLLENFSSLICKSHKAACHSMVGDVINEVNQFPTLSYNQIITYYYSSTQVKVILYDPLERAPNPLIRTSIPCTDE